ncbi:hypothetical protein B0H63DRAFT_14313 [Podospora didyma]|uniref:G domain-containing protein n=1 Tax=Podospora didyma TaxID=330526 RepID=A0AAE0U6Z4_9PEZI|nr:hypothetical protein B0H63DRAFT_14313 [Podospora didyma]
MNALKRPALGQHAQIGTLYDARRDALLPESIINVPLADGALSNVPLNHVKHTIGQSDSLKEKLATMGLGPELSASFLAGMVPVLGAAKYLTQECDALPTIHRALHYTITTSQSSMNFASPALSGSLDLSRLSTNTAATHVVTAITWGGQAVVSASRRLQPGADPTTIEAEMAASFDGFDTESPLSDESSELGERNPFDVYDDVDVKLYSDLCENSDDDDNDGSISLEAAFQLAKRLQKLVKASPGGQGEPIAYSLLPIGFLVTLGAAVADTTPAGQLSSECIERLIGLVDDLAIAQQLLTAYHQTLQPFAHIIRQGHMEEVEQKLVAATKAVSDLMFNFTRALHKIRSGDAGSQVAWQLTDEVLGGDVAPSKLIELREEYADKLDFISMAMASGATYLPVEGPARKGIKDHLPQRGIAYVFFFNTAVMKNAEAWDINTELLEGLLNAPADGQQIIVADCISDMKMDRPFISSYSYMELVSEDMVEAKKVLAEKHLIGFYEGSATEVENMPMARKSVIIPCPGQNCNSRFSQSAAIQWTCFQCHLAMDFCPSDGYFYCDCGKIPINAVVFNCQRPTHGLKYTAYSSRNLSMMLKNLPAPQEMNILVLGESGVGKSTFINAFVNYLTFSSLDEGLEARQLNWVIPCSFTTQVTEPRTGRLIPKDVKVGYDKDERDGSAGSSATQQATVYPLYIGSNLVRLIDTPGIGDTRGADQDKENLANVLSVLRNYPSLHGILILLKPNNPRLNVMFRFCIKELLSSLHRSAAGNIAFGFTNTRGSNYKPGDTFKPLQALLSDYSDVIPGLFNYNVYCFDSESFRYLAAKKQGVDMGNIEDYRRSWGQSTRESERLLEYFQTLQPHHTQQTLSLNETRHLISQLTAPMQQISRAISDSLASSEKQAEELKNTKLTGKELMTRLTIQKVVVEATQLKKPKTVCSNEACVEPIVNSDDGNTVLLRKNLCHNPCCLTNVPVGRVGTPGLKNCTAFSGGTPCKICGHNWEEHEHIMVKYSSNSVSTKDPEVERQLNDNGNVAKAKEAALAALRLNMLELKAEHEFLQKAAAKFSIYMKKNSITHYNDATIEYMDHLIKDERSKLRIGASRARLEALERDKAQYQSFVDAMEAGLRADSESNKSGGRGKASHQQSPALNERGVAALIQELYGMKHYGRMLKDLAKVVGRAYEANFRERPYRVRGGKGHQLVSWIAASAGIQPTSGKRSTSPGTDARKGYKTAQALRIPERPAGSKLSLSSTVMDYGSTQAAHQQSSRASSLIPARKPVRNMCDLSEPDESSAGKPTIVAPSPSGKLHATPSHMGRPFEVEEASFNEEKAGPRNSMRAGSGGGGTSSFVPQWESSTPTSPHSAYEVHSAPNAYQVHSAPRRDQEVVAEQRQRQQQQIPVVQSLTDWVDASPRYPPPPYAETPRAVLPESENGEVPGRRTSGFWGRVKTNLDKAYVKK